MSRRHVTLEAFLFCITFIRLTEKVVFRRGDEVLVVINHKDTEKRPRLNLPGGGVEIGENPLQALNREIEEELIIRNPIPLSQARLVQSGYARTRRRHDTCQDLFYTHKCYWVYLIDVPQEFEAEPRRSEDGTSEVHELRWIRKEDLASLIKECTFKKIILRAIIEALRV